MLLDIFAFLRILGQQKGFGNRFTIVLLQVVENHLSTCKPIAAKIAAIIQIHFYKNRKVVLVYKCRQKKLNNLYYKRKSKGDVQHGEKPKILYSGIQTADR